jgi:hypothetical protein
MVKMECGFKTGEIGDFGEFGKKSQKQPFLITFYIKKQASKRDLFSHFHLNFRKKVKMAVFTF